MEEDTGRVATAAYDHDNRDAGNGDGTVILRPLDQSVGHVPAPIDQLPAELLSDVMCLSLPHIGFADPKWPRFRDTLRLARVSRRWKEVAENTPELWCFLKIYAGMNLSVSPDTDAVAYSRMKTWVIRSKSAPLCICYMPWLRFFPETGQAMAFFDLVKINLHRCRQISIIAPSHMISSLPDVPMPYLDTVRLDYIDRDGHDAPFAAAPQIRCVYLSGIGADFNVNSFNWSSLEHLTIAGPGVAFIPCMAMLAESRNLLSLKLTLNGLTHEYMETWWGQAHPGPRYEKLHTLEVELDAMGVDFSFFTDWVFLPALRHLRVVGNIEFYSDIVSMISRDGCQLAYYLGNDWFTTGQELLKVFRAMPDLRILEMGGKWGAVWEFDKNVVERMTFTAGQPLDVQEYVLPKLESLAIHVTPNCYPQLVEAMLASRSNMGGEAPPTRLQYAQVGLHRWSIRDGGEPIREVDSVMHDPYGPF